MNHSLLFSLTIGMFLYTIIGKIIFNYYVPNYMYVPLILFSLLTFLVMKPAEEKEETDDRYLES
ncbi:hypothetical protein [Salimicrobium halophilum]|uniref:Uncharacterized protein n=1 Tax=Salimicrobium halophilum TaxID=86666 RepID=A0A1G8R2D0_9BACI|nr:hypothetical protein [Salimicrobium halophilum]SDJ11003.1 hypothetical protein SAMN04490247_0772 [Salimicrobium halophilum]